jgi:MFS family permease
MSNRGTATAEASDPYEVLRRSDFLRYLLGRLVAVLGQQMLTVAVGWELYDRTGSALALGLVGLTEMVAMVLLTLPAGHLADNHDRKRIIQTALLVSSAASIGLALISAWHGPVSGIYACLFTAAAARTFLWPASSAFLTSLVPRALFPRAVTWNSGAFQLSSVAGPALGGVLMALMSRHVAHPPSVIYGLNALAALTCFGLVWSIGATHAVARPEKMTLASLATGFRFVFDQRLILGMITLDMFAVFLGGATALLPVYARDILRVGPEGLGLLQAALPLGAMTSALFLAHRPPMERAGRALLWAVSAFGVATVAFGLSRWFWFSFTMLVLCGMMDNVSVVVRHTSVQLLTPDEKRGRVSAVNSLFIGTSNELGGFESGLVAHLCGPVFSVVSGGIGTILVTLAVAWMWPEIRRYGRLEGPS